ncbi:hypothetical protein LSAT2_026008 [Lamellibrachia satsuma]|nr:hypothetical protein LSAT2_026008 [Lamellibrachia satsuma]
MPISLACSSTQHGSSGHRHGNSAVHGWHFPHGWHGDTLRGAILVRRPGLLTLADSANCEELPAESSSVEVRTLPASTRSCSSKWFPVKSKYDIERHDESALRDPHQYIFHNGRR